MNEILVRRQIQVDLFSRARGHIIAGIVVSLNPIPVGEWQMMVPGPARTTVLAWERIANSMGIPKHSLYYRTNSWIFQSFMQAYVKHVTVLPQSRFFLYRQDSEEDFKSMREHLGTSVVSPPSLVDCRTYLCRVVSISLFLLALTP